MKSSRTTKQLSTRLECRMSSLKIHTCSLRTFVQDPSQTKLSKPGFMTRTFLTNSQAWTECHVLFATGESFHHRSELIKTGHRQTLQKLTDLATVQQSRENTSTQRHPNQRMKITFRLSSTNNSSRNRVASTHHKNACLHSTRSTPEHS